ncbi:amidohydrolase [uncultured Roseobacter sp.]|uniref:amidohydrolase n=1 Tax=uncultured Roseobacter sp. TaxID=114847 RepID=UPI0026195586|nr:amidohydrolase [uncultured Roseobacter sp.]
MCIGARAPSGANSYNIHSSLIATCLPTDSLQSAGHRWKKDMNMQRNDYVDAVLPDVISWQRRLHRTPELGFAEEKTADFVAHKLAEFGLEVHRDVSETAVVGVLTSGMSSRTAMFRAELDALPVQEATGLAHSSEVEGAMHACGHDAHTAMLLGAAKLLSETPNFDGTLYFVFQPAEEVHGGGKKMVADGLLARFPAEKVFSQHNWPGVKEEAVIVTEGPIMAGVDDFTLTFMGKGAHAAMPELGDDPVLAAAEFISSAQRIVSRTVDPKPALVLSFTQVHGGRINNIVPGQLEVQGTARFFNPDFSDHVAARIAQIAGGIAQAHGLDYALDYRKGYPAVVNSANGAATAKAAADSFLPAERVVTDEAASLGCEDFSYLLNAVGDGAYIWLAAGDVGPRKGLHGDRFVFNDKLFPIGLRMWVSLAETALPQGTS